MNKYLVLPQKSVTKIYLAVDDLWYTPNTNNSQKLYRKNTWKLLKKELNYVIYKISFNILKNVVFI